MPANAHVKCWVSNHIYAGTCRDLRLDFSQQAIRLKVI